MYKSQLQTTIYHPSSFYYIPPFILYLFTRSSHAFESLFHNKFNFDVFFFSILKMLSLISSATGIKKEDDKWEWAYFYYYLLQLALLSSTILIHWPSIQIALLPVSIALGGASVMLVIVLLGLLQTSSNGIYVKRIAAVIGVVMTTSLLVFFIDLGDFIAGKRTVSVLHFALELLIPEAGVFIPVTFFLYRTATRLPRILSPNNRHLINNTKYIQSLLPTQFTANTRIRQVIQAETHHLRYLICFQLYKSFRQFPSILQSPQFPRM